MSQSIHAFSDDALGTLDATGIAQAIQNKEVSAKEITQAAIDRAQKINPKLNAIVIETYDRALELKHANQDGFFWGVPTFIKDNVDIQGYPTQYGTGVFKAKKAPKNSTFVNQFLSTGLNFLGKSTLPEFALNCSAENERWGITSNPWNTEYTTGGSSSGSGALVASGVVPIAHANDGAGSIRIPAACCGLVGLKPSRNRLVNFDQSEILPINIGYEGVLTRSVRDTANFLAEAEHFFQNPNLPKLGRVQSPIKKKLKIAFIENENNGQALVDEDTYQVQLETAKLLESLSHDVELIKIPLDIEKMKHHFLNYYGFLAFLFTKMNRISLQTKLDYKELEPFSYGLTNNFLKNAWELPKSIRLLKKKIHGFENNFYKKYDILMTPVTALKTPKLGYLSPLLSAKEIMKRSSSYAPFTGLQNVSGAPAISLPLGRDSNGMPIGVHFSAPLGQDALLLALAFELEAAQPWKSLYDIV